MPPSEAERADLYTGLSKVLSPSQTETLMSVVRLDDQIATKSDVARVENRLEDLRAELAAMTDSFTAMKDSVDRRIDRVFFAMMAMPVAIIAAVATIFG